VKLQDPKPSYAEGQAPPNDHSAANSNCPQHKMNDHLPCDEYNKETPSTANDMKALNTNVGATYNE